MLVNAPSTSLIKIPRLFSTPNTPSRIKTPYNSMPCNTLDQSAAIDACTQPMTARKWEPDGFGRSRMSAVELGKEEDRSIEARVIGDGSQQGSVGAEPRHRCHDSHCRIAAYCGLRPSTARPHLCMPSLRPSNLIPNYVSSMASR